MSEIINDQIIIEVGTIEDLLLNESGKKICIPEYQRPYVWDTDKVEALFKDIEDFQMTNIESHYYIGAILFHRKDGKLNIIDGQQRITTLLTIDHVLNESNSLIAIENSQFELMYRSPVSEENIIRNRDFILMKLNTEMAKLKFRESFSKLIFTYIITDNEDEAFTFFDSQNNRGITLSSVDFLKSYHLKAIKGQPEEEAKQAHVAKRWDLNNGDQYLDKFFNLYLWRTRNWKGKRVQFENKDRILNEFQKKTKNTHNDSIQLYANFKNRLASELNFSVEHGIQIRPQAIPVQITAKDVPFSLRQPIQKGVAFFMFTEKYVALYRYIFNYAHIENSNLAKFIDFHKQVIVDSGLNQYLKDFFEVCTLIYYDKFEQVDLYDFALWLDYLLGAYRIKQSSIVAQTPVRIVRDLEQNLFDVIESAYLPDEVFSFINRMTDKEVYVNEQITGNGVQNRYKKAVLKYYKQPDDTPLQNKITWINDVLSEK